MKRSSEGPSNDGGRSLAIDSNTDHCGLRVVRVRDDIFDAWTWNTRTGMSEHRSSFPSELIAAAWAVHQLAIDISKPPPEPPPQAATPPPTTTQHRTTLWHEHHR